MYSEYRRRTYDPTWVLKFSDIFDGEEMMLTRSKASRFLKENKGQLDDEARDSPDVDDLLDFFEDLGFFMQGDQITAEAAHHAFYHWIRGYYSTTQPYLKVGREKKPPCWEHVEMLYNVTNQIEREIIKKSHKSKKFLDEKDTEKFLDEEIALVPSSPASGIEGVGG
jgi:hypothetical protein